MKTFDDLVFEPHPIKLNFDRIYAGESVDPSLEEMYNARWAVMDFPNGYGISVLFGIMFYSNGRDTYEVCDTYHGDATHGTIRAYVSRDEITEIMKEIQQRE